MSGLLDQISEAIGGLRAGQENVERTLVIIRGDILRLFDGVERTMKELEARVELLEKKSDRHEGAQAVHARWAAFIATVVASIATGVIEGLIWIFGGHR